MERINIDLLTDEAKRELIEFYNHLKIKTNIKKRDEKLPEGFYNPIKIKSYNLISKREEIYER